jgi:hypothetical protein
LRCSILLARAAHRFRVESEQSALMWFNISDQGCDLRVIEQGICEDLGWRKAASWSEAERVTTYQCHLLEFSNALSRSIDLLQMACQQAHREQAT